MEDDVRRARLAQLQADGRRVYRELQTTRQACKRRRLSTITMTQHRPKDRVRMLSAMWVTDFVVSDAVTVLEKCRSQLSWGTLTTQDRETP